MGGSSAETDGAMAVSERRIRNSLYFDEVEIFKEEANPTKGALGILH